MFETQVICQQRNDTVTKMSAISTARQDGAQEVQQCSRLSFTHGLLVGQGSMRVLSTLPHISGLHGSFSERSIILALIFIRFVIFEDPKAAAGGPRVRKVSKSWSKSDRPTHLKSAVQAAYSKVSQC